MGTSLSQDELKDTKESFDMTESAFEIVHDAKNNIGELAPTKLPNPYDKDAPKLKRLAPRRPKQQPKNQPNKTRTDD